MRYFSVSQIIVGECGNARPDPPTSARRFAPHNQRMHLTAPVHEPFGLIPGLAGDPQRLSRYGGRLRIKGKSLCKGLSSLFCSRVIHTCKSLISCSLVSRKELMPALWAKKSLNQEEGAMVKKMYFFIMLITCLCVNIAISNAGVVGDINNDGRIGLEEAIYALQVVAGIKLHPEGEEQIRANLAAAVSAYNNKDINTIMSYFSLNYLDDGRDYNTLREDFVEEFSDPQFEQISYTINSVAVSESAATVSVTWDDAETEVMNWIKENGNWKIYGNQEKYGIGLFSGHWTGGYHAEIFVEDPNQNATSVRATGPGISGTLEFEYKSGDGISPARWWGEYNPFLGSSVPTEPQTFSISVTDGSGTYSYQKTITGYVVQFATDLSPTGTASGAITFSWTGITNASGYSVELSDSNYNRIWNRYDIKSTTTTVVYDGPQLSVGETYHYNVVSRIETDGVSNSSFAKAQFTYE